MSERQKDKEKKREYLAAINQTRGKGVWWFYLFILEIYFVEIGERFFSLPLLRSCHSYVISAEIFYVQTKRSNNRSPEK